MFHPMIDPIPQSDGRLSFPFRIIQTLVAAVAQEIARRALRF